MLPMENYTLSRNSLRLPDFDCKEVIVQPFKLYVITAI